jgi:4-amino-4-deoxy-L-arabinose transferase-like glycosyltransferase
MTLFERPKSTLLSKGQWQVILPFLVVAILIRWSSFGHPLLHMDENFYLLVGDRMVNAGAWPYIDIWDRKPVGLFVLFAGFRMLGGDGFIQYQAAALLAVAATAFILYRLAVRSIGHWSAFAAGVFYLAGLTFFGGYGGQAPVFFNGLMAAAVLCLVRGVVDDQDSVQDAEKRIFRAGIGCMLLVGLALQIKYSIVFEGLFFGLVLIFAARHVALGTLAIWVITWVGCALLPTLIAWVVYALAGYNDAFVYANFISIFKRASSFDNVAQMRLLSLLGLLSPLLILSAFAWKLRVKPHVLFALGWLGFALIGLLVMGTYYNHYGQPIVLPASLTAAIGLSSLRWNKRGLGMTALVVLATVIVGSVGTYVKLARKGNADDITHLMAMMPKSDTRCPWLMGTLGATLYLQSKACLPTAYPLSGHLFERHESGAIGVDQNTEIDAILAKSPPMITMDRVPRPEEDLQQRARFLARLNADYRLAEDRDVGKTGLLIYLRKPANP